MAFVNRTTRTNNRVGFTRAATHSTVGPGSYELENSIAQSRPSYAPFGSTNQRSSGAPGMARPEMVTPGPGSYVEPTPKRRIAAASDTFRSSTVRMKEKKVLLTPGPGAYEEKRTGFNRHQFSQGGGSPQPLQVQTLKQQSGPSVKWVRVPTAPSIPAPNQAFGYEEGDRGELMQQKPMGVGHSGRSGDTVGPGDYTPSHGPQSTKRATDFGRGNTVRADPSKLFGVGNPGPGQYNANVDIKSSLLPAKQSSVFESRTGRSGAVKTNVAQEDVPGPGHYASKGYFGSQNKDEHLQFFGSTSRRFDEGPRAATRKNGGPGPGAYKNSNPSSFKKASAVAARLEAGKKHAGAGVGFKSTASRWRGQEPRLDAPKTGPGRYEAKGLADNLQSKVTSRAGAFGCTTKRFHKLRSPAADNPGPGWYKSSEVEAQAPGGVSLSGATGGPTPAQSIAYRRSQQPRQAAAPTATAFPIKNPATAAKQSANFESTSGRGNTAPTYLAEVPPPGTYNVGIKWSTGSGAGLMGSGGTRFKEPSNLSAASDKPPGPGRYEASSSLKPAGDNRKNILQSAAPRFKAPVSTLGPGPGSYDAEFLYGNLNKPTFNMSIADASAQ